jgi:integrase
LASLKKMKGNYYSRIRTWNGIKQIEKLIPLRTNNKSNAHFRHRIVQKHEKDIKNGLEFDFPWLKENGGSTSVKIKTLSNTIEEYLQYRFNKVRESTRRRDKVSLNQLLNEIGDIPIQNLNSDYFDGEHGFINGLLTKGYSPTGINISIRHIKTYLNWLNIRMNYIENQIHFDKLKNGKPLPRYLNESELNQIYTCNELDKFYKRAFYFYENTGCRPSEPFLGELYGNWLIIDTDNSKGKSVRQIKLTSELVNIYHELVQFRDQYSLDGSNNPNESAYHRLATIMRKIVKQLSFNGKKISLKSFRHTYGIKRITISGNIYQVARDMGHSKTSTTEIYLQYPEQRRLDDFPSLKEYILKEELIKEKAIRDTQIRDTNLNNYKFLFDN